MSKRDTSQAMKDGYSIFIKDLEELGYIPEGVVNWIALMGWSYDDHTEFFTMQDLIEKFSLEHLNPSPAAINFTKLDYFNGLHIRSLSREDLANRLAPYMVNVGLKVNEDILYQAIPVIRERLVTLDDVIPVAGFFFKETVSPDPSRLVVTGLTPAESANIARKVYHILAPLPLMSKDLAEPPIRNFMAESDLKAGQVFGLLREAVTGQKDSPPLFESMEIIGKDKVLERIQFAINILEQM